MYQLAWVVSKIVNLLRSWGHSVLTCCAEQYLKSCFFFGIIFLSTATCVHSYSLEVFRSPWRICVWGSNDLKDVIPVAKSTPVLLLQAQVNFPCWHQYYHGCMHERSVSVWPWGCLIPTTSNQDFCWKGSLIRSYVPKTCNKQLVKNSLWQLYCWHLSPRHSPGPCAATMPVSGGGERRKQLEQLLFRCGAWVPQEWGRTSETSPKPAASHA